MLRGIFHSLVVLPSKVTRCTLVEIAGNMQLERSTREVSSLNRLVPVLCPACGAPHSIERVAARVECSCGQPLDPDVHREDLMRAREHESFKRVNARKTRSFLYDLVNLPDDHQRMRKFINRFGEFFPKPFPANCWVAEETSRFELIYGRSPISEFLRSEICFGQLAGCRNYLRFVWSERNREAREWRMHELRKKARLLTVHPS